jgi:hypothetical protein
MQPMPRAMALVRRTGKTRGSPYSNKEGRDKNRPADPRGMVEVF